ncbi:MAG: ATP-dependent helicase [Chlorobium sp.]|nr:ATP-dependent helicase [Chlorobium sp.]
MNISDFNLNENQRLAVDWAEGPLLVLAGPGSGKTLVLTLRAAQLLQEDSEASVLALTFTTNAASEMRERLDQLMGGRADRAHLCTFHSFAGDILRQHGSHVGIQPDYSLITLEEDRIALLEQVIKELTCDKTLIPSDRRNLLVLLDRLFAESYNGEPIANGLAKTPPWVPILFESYCQTLKNNNRLDYGGLLHFAKKLLLQNTGVARLIRLAWQFVCVDEFHDTNRAQYDLLCLIVGGKQPNLFVVADDDQIIYQWNGASPERLFALRKDFNMATIQLPENFRCPPMIIQLANNLIVNNQTRTTDKEPLTARKSPEESDILKAQIFNNEDDEVAYISTIIIENEWEADECAVLARNTRLLQRAAQALEQAGLKPFLAQRKNEFECASIRWLHAALRLANARHDRELLRRLCVAWQDFAASVIEVESIEATAALNGGDFLRAWIDTASDKTGEKKHQDLLAKVRQDLVDRLLFIDLLEWFWSQEWLDDPLESEEVGTWKELHGSLLREHSPENVTLHMYLQEMDLKSKAPIRVPGSISCFTVHSAKGLEFKHVFLIGMAEEVFPSYQAVTKGANSREMEEERRNCFVAITRVQETLHISWAQRYNGYPKKPSRFIEEMGFTV